MLLQMAKFHKISFFFMIEEYSIAYIHCIFFIHSSTDRHLHCFHLAIVNNGAMNTEVHVSFEVVFLIVLDIYPGVELLGHMAEDEMVGWHH